MSSDPIIRVEGLSKKYQLVHQRKTGPTYRRFSDALVGAALKPFRRARDLALQRSGTSSSIEHEEFWALRDVSFDVRKGEVLGVIGRNGAGKSTLLKILSRITDPSKGRVVLGGRVASLLEVGTGFHGELTGRENIYLNGAILGMTRGEIRVKFDEIVSFSECEQFLDTPVKHYSSGMYVRLAFAVAAHLDPEILIVDEVLAVGDMHFQKKCLGKMQDVSQKEGRTVLFVSHNLGTVLNLCSRGVVLEKGRVVCDKPVAEAVEFYQHSLFQPDEGADGRPPHVLYDTSKEKAKAPVVIIKVEVLDTAGQPKPVVGTWDSFVLRIWYRSESRIPRASVVLQVNTSNSVTAFLLSTEPDGTLPLDVLPGDHAVDCTIENLPLSAGEYTIGAGLAIPNAEWLWFRQDLANFTVSPRDVFGSGLAPSASRALVAPRHEWRISDAKLS